MHWNRCFRWRARVADSNPMPSFQTPEMSAFEPFQYSLNVCKFRRNAEVPFVAVFQPAPRAAVVATRFMRDRSGTQDNAPQSPRNRTAARRRGEGSAGGR